MKEEKKEEFQVFIETIKFLDKTFPKQAPHHVVIMNDKDFNNYHKDKIRLESKNFEHRGKNEKI